MSFHLCVFHTTKPVSVALAAERYVAYCEEEDLTPYIEPSLGVAAFVAELSETYPDLDDIALDDQEARAGSPWASGHDVSEGHVHMAMSFSSAGSITDDVTRLARKHGLVCYCPQSDEILTAPESLLSAKDRRRLRTNASREVKRAHRPKRRGPTLKEVAAAVEPEMAVLGFQHEGSGMFSKALTDDIDGCFALSVAEGLDYSRIEVVTGLRHRALSALDRRLWGAHPGLPVQPLIGIPLFVLHRRQRGWRRAGPPEGNGQLRSGVAALGRENDRSPVQRGAVIRCGVGIAGIDRGGTPCRYIAVGCYEHPRPGRRALPSRPKGRGGGVRGRLVALGGEPAWPSGQKHAQAGQAVASDQRQVERRDPGRAPLPGGPAPSRAPFGAVRRPALA